MKHLEGFLHLVFTLAMLAIVWAMCALIGRDQAKPLDAEDRSTWQPAR